MVSAQQPSPTQIASQNSQCRIDGPKTRTAFYRADSKPTTMPRVLMSKDDEASCKVKVGDTMPAIELPKLGGNEQNETVRSVRQESHRRCVLEG